MYKLYRDETACDSDDFGPPYGEYPTLALAMVVTGLPVSAWRTDKHCPDEIFTCKPGSIEVDWQLLAPSAAAEYAALIAAPSVGRLRSRNYPATITTRGQHDHHGTILTPDRRHRDGERPRAGAVHHPARPRVRLAAACRPGRSWTGPDGGGQGRTPPPDGTAFIVVALFAVAQVAVVAFSGSWQHQYELSVHLGQAHWVAGMQPLSVEGLIASATLVIWFAARYGHGVPLGAYLVLAAGVGQTVLMNVGADYRWPLAWPGDQRMAGGRVRRGVRDGGVACPQTPGATMDRSDDGLGAAGQPGKNGSEGAGLAGSRVNGVAAVAAPSVQPPAGKVDKRTALDKAAAAIALHPGWTDAALARSAGVSTKTIQRARNAKTGSGT